MAFTSAGYDGTVDEIQFAGMIPKVGASEYGVEASGHFQVTAVAGQDRTVSVAAGTAWGHGVLDVSDSNETVQLATVPSGSRWDMIVLRRDWQPPGGATTVQAITGGTSMDLPWRNNTPGIKDDQPLALVQVQAGKTQPVQIIDLRVWSRNGGATARHELVRSYYRATGTMVEINGVTWRRRVGVNNLPEWVDVAKLDDTGWLSSGVSISPTPNLWKLNGYDVRRKNGDLWARVDVTYTRQNAIEADGNGDIPDMVVCTFPSGFRPTRTTWDVQAKRPGISAFYGRIEPSGQLFLTHGTPGAQIILGRGLTFYVHCPTD